MNIIGIYKITSPKGKIYIGQSKDIEKRWYSYKKLNCKTQPKIYNSLKKLGVDSHTFEIIYECNAEELDYFEKYFISKYNSDDIKNGLNCNFSLESKIESSKLEFNVKRIEKERKLKKQKYMKVYLAKRKEIKKQEEFIKLALYQITVIGKGFILEYTPQKHTTMTYEESLLPF